jgi:ADP-ribose pyrophosphatase YjhB (NUDIX family)
MILPIQFCSQCGARTSLTIPPGDNLPRFVCEACQHIHYQNPKIVVGTIPQWEDHILLCRRAIEPGYGKWTLPGGFMEDGETVEQGAMRETVEECGTAVKITSLYSVYSIPHINQVHMMFRANMRDSHVAAGEESLEVRLFRHDDIPWDELAFRVIRATMKHYVDDSAQDAFSVHVGTILPASDHPHTSRTR